MFDFSNFDSRTPAGAGDTAISKFDDDDGVVEVLLHGVAMMMVVVNGDSDNDDDTENDDDDDGDGDDDDDDGDHGDSDDDDEDDGRTWVKTPSLLSAKPAAKQSQKHAPEVRPAYWPKSHTVTLTW